METKNLLRTNATVFSIVAIVHLLRVFFGWQFQVGTVQISMIVSVIAVLIIGWLAYMNYTH